MAPNDAPGSDGLPNAWLFERINTLEARIQNHGAEMRINFRELGDKIDHRYEQVNDLTGRVIAIETKQETIEESARRRGAINGAFAAGLVAVGWEALKRALGLHQ